MQLTPAERNVTIAALRDTQKLLITYREGVPVERMFSDVLYTQTTPVLRAINNALEKLGDTE